MNRHGIGGIALVWLCLIAGRAAAKGPETPEALVEALGAASVARDAEAAAAWLSDDFRYAIPFAGQAFAGRLARKGAPIEWVGLRAAGDRAAITARIGDEVRVLLAVKTADGWRLDGVALTAEAAASFLAGTPMRPPRDEALLLAGGALADALGRGDAEAAARWMTPAFLEAERDGGRDLIAQLARKGLTLAPRDARAVDGRGALMGDVLSGPRPVDRVWLLAERAGEGPWRFVAITEDVQRVQAVLSGRVAVDFEPRRLPPDAGAQAAIDALRGALMVGDGDAAVGLLAAPPKNTPGIGQPRARRWLRAEAGRGSVVSPAAVHADVQRGRAAARVVFRGGGRDEKGGGETVWFYLARVGAQWAVVDLGFGLSARWFYTP